MVAGPVGLAHRLADLVRADWSGLRAQVGLGRPAAPPMQLHTYRLSLPGGQLRVHLRLHPDGTGLLMLNGVEALHLSPLTAHALRTALSAEPPPQALAALRGVFPGAPRATLAAELERAQAVAAELRRPGQGCWACRLNLPQPPPHSVRPAAPYKADLALLYSCNNRCSHCYNQADRRALPPLPLEAGREVLRRLWDEGVPYVIFTGGEPTLHPHLVELVRYAEELGQITGLNTNGRRLADPTLARALHDAGLDHVQITLHSSHAAVHDRLVGTQAFEATVRGVQEALAAGLHTLTNTTLLAENLCQAVEMVDFLHGLGLRTFAMNGMIHSGCGRRHGSALTPEQLAPALRQVRERAEALGMRFLWYTPTCYCRLSPEELGLGAKCCNAAEYSVCVEPNAEVLPCQSYYQSAGNLLRDPWERVWDSELFRRLRYRREDPAEAGLPPQCAECEQLEVCAGGCPLEREALTASAEVNV